MRHVHADLMIKYANDTTTEIEFLTSEGSWALNSDPSFSPYLEYREKPKSMRYRVALLRENGRVYPYIVIGELDLNYQIMERSSIFIRWLDGEKEVEI